MTLYHQDPAVCICDLKVSRQQRRREEREGYVRKELVRRAPLE